MLLCIMKRNLGVLIAAVDRYLVGHPEDRALARTWEWLPATD